MANFNTHLGFGVVASGLGATMALAAGLAKPSELLALTTAGAIGSVLPDIDLNESGPSRFLFGALGVLLAFGALFWMHGSYSLTELWLVWMGVFLVARFGLCHVFLNYTAHRGIWHSVLAAALFMALTAIVMARLFGKDPAFAWLAGVFVFVGYLTHLALDEVYAVNFDNARLKKSFGTALKLFDRRSALMSLLMAAAVAVAVAAAPPFRPFATTVASADLKTFFKEKLWPRGQWFAMRSAEARGERD